MKTSKLLLGMLISGSAFMFASCDDGEPDVNIGPLGLTSAIINGTDSEGEPVSITLTSGAAVNNVPLDGVVTITFSKAVDESTINATNVTLSDGASAVDFTTAVDGAVVTLTPSSLEEETTYTLTLTSNIVAEDGGVFSQVTRSFLTVLPIPLPEGLVAWWKFEDDGADETGVFNADNEIDITYVAGRSAAAGNAASFNGTTSIIEVPNGVNLTNTENFTLSFWMNLDSANYNADEAHKGYFVLGFAGYRGFQFEIPGSRENGKFVGRYEFEDGTLGNEDLWADCTGNLGWQGWTFSKDLAPTGGFKAEIDNQWAWITVVYNGEDKTGTIYLNGEKIKSQDFNLWPDDSKTKTVVGLGHDTNENVSTKFAIGFYSGTSSTDYDGWAQYSNPDHNHFKGQLDDMMIFHKAFSDAEVAAMYDGE